MSQRASGTAADPRELHRRIGRLAFDRGLVDVHELSAAIVDAGRRPGSDPDLIWVESGLLTRPELDELMSALGLTPTGPVLHAAPGAESSEDPTTSHNLAQVAGSLARDDDRASGDGSAAARYLLGEELGRGGVGVVIKAFDRNLGRTVALKKLQDWPQPAEEVERFIEEAQATGQLEHPNIVPVYDLGRLAGGEVYYTMKRVRNRSLRNVIDGLIRGDAEVVSEYGTTRLLSIFLQVCQAMHYAHARGVIHRDLKPDNIMLGDYGEVHVMDWGLARILDRGVVTERSARGPEKVEPGMTIGTPAYMPPEQARGLLDIVDERSDLYSLGVVLYEMMTLRQPSTRDGIMPTLLAVISDPIPPPRAVAPDRGIGEAMEAIILKALEKDRDLRWRSARELHDAVERYLDGRNEIEAMRHAREGERFGRAYEQAKSDMQRLEREVREISGRVRDWQPVSVKRAVWELQDRQQQAAVRMVRAFGDAVREYTQALAREPELAVARQGLAQLFWSRCELAERDGNELDRLYFETQLRHYDDGSLVERMTRQAEVTVMSEPPGADVFVARYAERERVEVAGQPAHLGTTPVAASPFERGSYRLRLKVAGRPPVTLPLLVQRADPQPVRVVLPSSAQWREGFCYIPAGSSMIGGDAEALDPLPARRMAVQAFFMTRYPVTFGEYAAFLTDISRERPQEALDRLPRTRDAAEPLLVLGADGQWLPSETLIEAAMRELYPVGQGFEERMPVVAVRFEDAMAYLSWRSGRDGIAYRLPSELEWERAARGADGRTFPWGSKFDASFCRMSSSRATPAHPEPIGAFPSDRSPFDVHDLAGGVREWVTSPDLDLEHAMLRGGFWAGDARTCRSASRWRVPRSTRSATVGFRLAYGLDEVSR
jgi:serine/threonine-protein kinase